MTRRRRRSAGTPVSFFSFQDIITSVTGILILVTLLMTLELVTRARFLAEGPAPGPDALPALHRAIQHAEIRRDWLRGEVERLGRALASAAATSPLVTADELRRIEYEVGSTAERNDALRARQRETLAAVARERVELEKVASEAESAATRAQQLQAKADELRRSNRLVMLPGAGAGKSPVFVESSAAGLVAGTSDVDGRVMPAKRWPVGSLDALTRWAESRSRTREYFLVLVRPDGVETANEAVDRLRDAGFDVGWEPMDAAVTVFQPSRE